MSHFSSRQKCQIVSQLKQLKVRQGCLLQKDLRKELGPFFFQTDPIVSPWMSRLGKNTAVVPPFRQTKSDIRIRQQLDLIHRLPGRHVIRFRRDCKNRHFDVSQRNRFIEI